MWANDMKIKNISNKKNRYLFGFVSFNTFFWHCANCGKIYKAYCDGIKMRRSNCFLRKSCYECIQLCPSCHNQIKQLLIKVYDKFEKK